MTQVTFPPTGVASEQRLLTQLEASLGSDTPYQTQPLRWATKAMKKKRRRRRSTEGLNMTISSYWPIMRSSLSTRVRRRTRSSFVERRATGSTLPALARPARVSKGTVETTSSRNHVRRYRFAMRPLSHSRSPRASK